MSIKYQYNNGGRTKSKRARQSNDCVVRAIALATGMDYDTVYDELAALGRACGKGTDNYVWQRMVEKLGFDVQVQGNVFGPKTLNLVTEQLANTPAIIHCRQHVFYWDGEFIHDELMQHPGSQVFTVAVVPQGLVRKDFERRLTKTIVYE